MFRRAAFLPPVLRIIITDSVFESSLTNLSEKRNLERKAHKDRRAQHGCASEHNIGAEQLPQPSSA
jgi:hypothetical protein